MPVTPAYFFVRRSTLIIRKEGEFAVIALEKVGRSPGLGLGTALTVVGAGSVLFELINLGTNGVRGKGKTKPLCGYSLGCRRHLHRFDADERARKVNEPSAIA